MTQHDYSAGAAWMRGDIMPIASAGVNVTDWGLTHSDITYDVVHVWDGRFFRLDDYIDRFFRSIEKLRLGIPQGKQDVRDVLHAVVARSGLRRSYVSMVASRGMPSVPGTRDPRFCDNHFYAWCVPFVWVFQPDVIERGAHLMVPEEVERIAARSVDPTAKNYHWGDFTNGLFRAKEAGFDTVLLLDSDGHITEGPGYNVFVVKDGKVRTPRSGVLEGITRRTAMEICTELGIPSEEADISLDEIMQADEIFATTTGGGAVPVTRINGRVFSNDAVGPLTAAISKTYWAWHDRPEFSEPVDYMSA